MINSFSYPEYQSFFDSLVKEGITTSDKHNEDLVRYTKLNLTRSQRIDKTFKAIEEANDFFESVNLPLKFKIITEPWCGDAAQVVPVIASLAKLSESIETEVVLRDENEELINRYLTNGGKSIPIIIIIDGNTEEELGHWGPRPIAAQKMVEEYKATSEDIRPSYHEFVQEVQQWYNRDKTVSVQLEFIQKLKELLK